MTREVADVAREIGYPVTCIGTIALRNVAEHQELYEVGIGPLSRVGSVDPVCRMWVDQAAAAGHMRYQEDEYWCCSLDCARRFASEPDLHARHQG